MLLLQVGSTPIRCGMRLLAALWVGIMEGNVLLVILAAALLVLVLLSGGFK